MQSTPHSKLVDHLFRHEAGKINAILINKFGVHHIEDIEDAVQDALLKAMQIWGFKSIPDHPTAWILRVASNKLIDLLRKNTKNTVLEPHIHKYAPFTLLEEPTTANTISDDQLKLIFACCHPSLSVTHQLILTLKLVGGFNNKEIAAALLKKEDAVAKAFTRAKKKLKTQRSAINIPIEMGLTSRLYVVLKVIYLLFSEGYAPHSGAIVLKKEVCFEAIRLALLLSQNKYCNLPQVHALIALMCFHAARFDARINAQMQLVDLEHQDRNQYDKNLINAGTSHFEYATKTTETISDYHLQAAISYQHCIAQSYEETLWPQILELYDLQLQRVYSPVISLNRIVAYSKVAGTEKALQELEKFKQHAPLFKHKLLYATEAMFLHDLNRLEEALKAMDKAIALSQNQMEKAHLLKKKKKIENAI